MWELTEDDRELMALEATDSSNNEPPPDWYDRTEDEGEDFAALEAEINRLDPDHQAKLRDAVDRWEEAEHLDRIEQKLWDVPAPSW